ncbi:MAG: shikimate dehydrogenase [Anaerolineales bacterium]
MIRLGLVGYPLTHSLSPRLHRAALAACGLEGEYRLYPIAPQDWQSLRRLTDRLRSGKLLGLNVTLPHKQDVIPLLDGLTPEGRAIGAVNTLYLNDNCLIGHNTDAAGFRADLGRLFVRLPNEKRALVIGAGGGARAVVYCLLQAGWEVTVAALSVYKARALAEALGEATGAASVGVILTEANAIRAIAPGLTLIVNASPVGMLPHSQAMPWPEEVPFPPDAVVYDLVYLPRETRLVRSARQAGLRAMSGLGMLVEQAALSFECWTGMNVPRSIMSAAAEE